MSKYELKETQYGFAWGPMLVERIHASSALGVAVEITTPTGNKRNRLYIRVSPKGQRIIVMPIDGQIEISGQEKEDSLLIEKTAFRSE